jgi:hypothetical protein
MSKWFQEDNRTMTCPYCGCPDAAEAEEYGILAQGILAQAIFVCPACGQSITRGRWTTGSTRRAFLRALRIAGPVVLYAVAFWLLRPYLETLKRFGGSRSTPG